MWSPQLVVSVEPEDSNACWLCHRRLLYYKPTLLFWLFVVFGFASLFFGIIIACTLSIRFTFYWPPYSQLQIVTFCLCGTKDWIDLFQWHNILLVCCDFSSNAHAPPPPPSLPGKPPAVIEAVCFSWFFMCTKNGPYSPKGKMAAAYPPVV